MASGFPIKVNGVRIRTSEALYQACRYPDRPDVQRMIIEQRSPMTAKMKGKRYLGQTRSDWGKIRINVMRWCLRVKLAQNWDSFGELLLSTGEAPIVEDSRKDDFWGAKPSDGALVGINVLGRLLTELREELKGPDAGHLRIVQPLQITHFLLYGQPIGRVAYSDRRGSTGTVRAGHEIEVAQSSLERVGRERSSESDAEHKSEVHRSDVPQFPNVPEAENNNHAIPSECKRLAEVDFPIAEVSRHAAREKSIRHGHPSTLHLWWARRPLASSRAMLMALLLPDPCDPHCPDPFKTHAREILLAMRSRPGGWGDHLKTDAGLRRILLKFIADFANWDNSAKTEYLETGRALVRAAHPEETPLVVDPFAGGGSIPLEALRIGCEAFASDLNPVACLILKVMLEDVPRYGPDLADELRKVGAEIKANSEEELAKLYPKDPDGATPIAYLWARTVHCEAPGCGAEIPLMRSMWLCRKPNRKFALRTNVTRSTDGPRQVEFEIFEPESEADVARGTVTRARATCVCCNTVLAPERVRSQLADQRGGADAVFDDQGSRVGGARMTAVVTLKPGEKDRQYRLPTRRDYVAARKAQERVAKILNEWEHSGRQGLCPVPDEPLPPVGTLGFRVQRYGMLQWGDLFTARQKASLIELGSAVNNLSGHPSALKHLLALSVSRFADDFSSLSRWMDRGTPAATFTRQALPILWDFCELNPFDNASWSFSGSLGWIARGVESLNSANLGQVQTVDATVHPLPDQACEVWFSDPPYYDAIPYADLSDFFFVWLKRALLNHPILQDPFDPSNSLSPKTSEVVQDETQLHEGRRKDPAWFEERMAEAFMEGRRILSEDGVGSVVFAHKTTEGWEALLSGMVRGGWNITGSWPIATERPGRPRAFESAALETSVHLVCRPRSKDAPVGDWADLLGELPTRVADWMHRLQGEGVRGADLVFACVGPALEIYSRYSLVETAEGRAVGLPEYLERVWEVVGREALEQVLGTAEAQARNGAAGALEEDSRLTALFLWTMQSTSESTSSGNGTGSENHQRDGQQETPRRRASGYSLPFDVTRRFAQPLGIHLDDWESRIIETKKGVVRLLPVTERAEQLFGESGADAVADAMESGSNVNPQMNLFPEDAPPIQGRTQRRRRSSVPADGNAELTLSATTLDRVHAAMLLQGSGRSQALRNLLRSEQERGPEFLRLANAFTALYPRGSEEKRLLDAMLLAVPR